MEPSNSNADEGGISLDGQGQKQVQEIVDENEEEQEELVGVKVGQNEPESEDEKEEEDNEGEDDGKDEGNEDEEEDVNETENLHQQLLKMHEISTMMFFFSKMRNRARTKELVTDDVYKRMKEEEEEKKNMKKGEAMKRGDKKDISQTLEGKKEDVSKNTVDVDNNKGEVSKVTTNEELNNIELVKTDDEEEEEHVILKEGLGLKDIIKTMKECHDFINDYELMLPGNKTTRVDFNIRIAENLYSRCGDGFKVLKVDDELQCSEIVSVIMLDKRHEKIIVAFRGSQSKNDWKTNFKAHQTRIKNPLFKLKKNRTIRKSLVGQSTVVRKLVTRQPKTLIVHNGFWHSIFCETKKSGLGSKSDYLMDEVLKVLEDYPDYRVEITGFSLGGALSQVFALHVAASTNPLIKKPVKCFSFAAPKVGALNFRRAIQGLEEIGYLRLFRVASQGDVIPGLPREITTVCGGCIGLSTISLIVNQGLYYRKAGMEVKLCEKGVSYTHPKVPHRRCCKWRLLNFTLLRYDLEDQWKKQKKCCIFCYQFVTMTSSLEEMRGAHGCPVYYDRLIANGDEIKKYELQDLYNASLEGDEEVVRPVYC